jgi:putative transposase
LPPRDECEDDLKMDVEARVREGVKAVLGEVLQEEMTEHLNAGYQELTPARRAEPNGHYQCNLLTPGGKIERLEVPGDREGEFVTELFERYKRMSGDVEEAILEMYLFWDLGTQDSRRHRCPEPGEDRQGRRKPHRRTLEGGAKGGESDPSGRSLTPTYPYLYLDATYPKVRSWGERE